MPHKIPRAVLVAPPLAYFLYFYGIGGVGLLGPDEPRYASIARAMASSGDWITPRLWGRPWFEKPALLYWIQGAAFRLGLDTEFAARLPVALLAVSFLAFYWWILRREFGGLAASFATAILGTSGGWIVLSQVGTTDLPLAAAFSAAMLLCLPWVAKRETRWLPLASALLGLAVLAKGLVPLVLAVPLSARRSALRDWTRPRAVVPFLAVALPWYLLCYLRNGREFLVSFFWQHHFERFTSTALLHVQPWWFYLPVMAGLLLPWTPLVPLAARRGLYRDPRCRFLLAWALFGLVFFSAAANKLPGYLLPLLPAVAALMAIALAESRRSAPWLAACAVLLLVFPIARPMLAAAVETGLSHAPRPAFHWTWLLPLALGALVWMLDRRGRRLAAVLSIAAGATAGTAYLKSAAMTQLDRSDSARALWREIAPRAPEICVDGIERSWRYGLNYYSVVPLPDCTAAPKPLRLRQVGGRRPELAAGH
jgi:4-amino-4-deoxy-L-arabinose transferase-like glycosyltransferase